MYNFVIESFGNAISTKSPQHVQKVYFRLEPHAKGLFKNSNTGNVIEITPLSDKEPAGS